MPDATGDELILTHYRKQAAEHQLEASSTMLDETTREMEIGAILQCVTHALRGLASAALLEVGCGNGYLLAVMRERFPHVHLTGVDYSPDMLELAQSREVFDAHVARKDVRSLTFPSESFDVVVSERCIINLLDASDQVTALHELHRVLRPGGYLVLIEGFTDGLANLNRARGQLGLPDNQVPYHNLWFEKEVFLEAVGGRFELVGDANGTTGVPPTNFLSTHYFVSRVLYPAVTRAEIQYNTDFVKFFRFLPVQGDYSPIQLYFMRKTAQGPA